MAIDLINGSELLRQWVDDSGATPADLDALTEPDEIAWREEREAVLLVSMTLPITLPCAAWRGEGEWRADSLHGYRGSSVRNGGVRPVCLCGSGQGEGGEQHAEAS